MGLDFFDADETLFTFDSFTGLQRMFLDYGVTFSAEDFQDYQAVNKPLWVDYQNEYDHFAAAATSAF